MIEKITIFATSVVSGMGYLGLVLGLALNSVGIPIFPSEVLLPVSGALARQGRFNLFLVIGVAILAQLIGLSLGYFVASSGFIALVKKYGKYVFFSEHELETTQNWFRRRGELIVILATMLPVLKAYIGYPAGLAKMSKKQFLASALVGTTIWTLTFVLLGYYFIAKVGLIESYLRKFSLVIVAVILLAIIFYIYKRIKNKK